MKNMLVHKFLRVEIILPGALRNRRANRKR